MKTKRHRRLPFLLVAAACLLAGLAAGLVLQGVVPRPPATRLAAVHGPLMVLGFIGALIALERAAALGRAWGFGAPALLGVGALGTVPLAVPAWAGQVALLAGAALLLALYVPLWRRRPDDATLVQALGAAAACGAAALWLGGVEVPRLAPWLVAFLVLTIAGERLELARVQVGEGTQALVLAESCALLVAAAAALLWPGATLAVGLALGLLAATLLAADVARRTARTRGQAAFSGRLMLAGYLWLLAGALVWLTARGTPRGFAYDAALHSVTLGFVMSMVLAHAPTILPAVLGIRLPFRPVMYVPAVLLHASLAVRLVADAAGDRRGWQVGGALGVAAVLLFVLVAGAVALMAPARAAHGTGSRA